MVAAARSPSTRIVARDRVREGAERAVRRAESGELQVLQVGPPVAIEIDVPKGVIADHAAIMPGVERVGDRTIRFAHDDPETTYRGMLAVLRLVESVSG